MARARRTSTAKATSSKPPAKRPAKKKSAKATAKKATKKRANSAAGARRASSPKTPPSKEEKFAPELVAEAIRKANGFISDAARSLRCHPSTVRAYAKKHAIVADELKESRESLKDLAENKLVKAIKSGRAWAICFFLKTQAKDRGYIEKSQVELANPQESARAICDAIAEMNAATAPQAKAA